MSTFNRLCSDVQCSNCKNSYKATIQFKFGDTWQMQYCIGDKIKWGGNDIGRPNISEVKVYGILEEDKCPICLNINTYNEFDIIIKKDIIKELKLLDNYQDYYEKDGNYKVIKD